MTSESITFTSIYLIIISLLLGITFGILDVNSSSSLDGNSSANITVSNMTEESTLLANFTDSTASSSSIPNAQSVYEIGAMSVPASVKSFIIMIPDEAHHPPEDEKTISLKNPNFLPTSLEVMDGTEIAFVHGDPSHTHVEIVKDKDDNVVWRTIPVEHPGGSDIKILSSSGSPYKVSDKEFTNMEGKITVSEEKSTGNLTSGGFFVPTKDRDEFKSEFVDAGFRVISDFGFTTESVQKDLAGDNTLLIYTTTKPVKDAIKKLLPMIRSLPYE